MKRICFVTDSIFTYGGVQRVTAVIAKALSSEWDVTVMSFDSPSLMDTGMYDLQDADLTYRFFSYPDENKLVNICCKAYSFLYRRVLPQNRLTSSLYAKSSFTCARRKALAKALRHGRYDVVVGVHAPLAARLATIRHEIGGALAVGWIHNSFSALFGDDSLYIGRQLKRHYCYQFERLDRLAVLCHYDAQQYVDFNPLLKPLVIYNPLTLVPGAKSQGTSKRFLAVGRFSHLHKGFDLLIKAFALFAQTDSEWHLDIVGEGPERDLYLSLIKEHRMERRITIHPFTNTIQQHYSQAQIYVLSSRWEGFGLVLVEAMAHGLPVVSSNIPTSLEILGDYGIFFENESVEQLASALRRATRIDWQEQSSKALLLAKRFDIETIVGQWREMLE